MFEGVEKNVVCMKIILILGKANSVCSNAGKNGKAVGGFR